MIVTDRRIAWCGRGGELYRELRGDELIAAFLVEGDARRGWISVTQQRRDGVAEVDLLGVPDPARALAAIGLLVENAAP
jgi:hypothetical protein